MLSAVGRTFSCALRIGCAVHVMRNDVYELCETYGESMLPTLNYSGDYVHTSKLAKFGRGCDVGDIIIASKPTNPVQRVCKRICGMPGDYLCIDPLKDANSIVRVPEGHVWVTGDNMSQSIDSRSYGPLPMGLIRGRVFAVSSGFDLRWLERGFEDEA